MTYTFTGENDDGSRWGRRASYLQLLLQSRRLFSPRRDVQWAGHARNWFRSPRSRVTRCLRNFPVFPRREQTEIADFYFTIPSQFPNPHLGSSDRNICVCDEEFFVSKCNQLTLWVCRVKLKEFVMNTHSMDEWNTKRILLTRSVGRTAIDYPGI